MIAVTIDETAPELNNKRYFLPQCAKYHSIISQVYNCDIFYAKQYTNGIVTHILPFALIKNPLLGRKIVSMPYDGSFGDVITLFDCALSSELYDTVLTFAKNNRVKYVEIRTRGRNENLEQMGFYRDTSLVISDVDVEKVYTSKKYIKKRKKNNKLAEKYGTVVTTTDDINDLKCFYKIMSVNMREYGTPMYPYSYFERIWNTFHDTGDMVLIKGTYNRKMVSGLLLLFSGKTAVLKYSSTIDKYIKKRFYPTMKWLAIDICVQRKCPILNMGTSFCNDPGLIRAKEGFGAQTTSLVTYTKSLYGNYYPLSYYQKKYSWLIDLWKYQPLLTSQLLGRVFWKWYC